MWSHAAFIVLLVSLVESSCLYGTSHLQRRKTSNNTVEVATFGYTGPTGPLLWKTLSVDNNLCEEGENQSPINIDASIKVATSAPRINIQKVDKFEFENLGSTVEVLANGQTEFGNKTFNLKQFHFHSPSEHRINEEYFPLEMHMVHEAAGTSSHITVLGLLFDMSTNNTELLGQLSSTVSKINEPGAITDSGPLNFDAVVKHLETTPLRQYSGSLTTPPCKEGITFLIAEQPLPINPTSFNAMKKVIKFNSRFTQGKLGEGNIIERAFAAAKKQNGGGNTPQQGREGAGVVNAPPKGADVPPQSATDVVSTIYASTITSPGGASRTSAEATATPTGQATE
ncbi:carbonic anhydrase [Tothia fuscella]|uniref:Carbonic anhydrase n=1 Tax=Tothia fuscella TaxID=1048955 RepID=A0A9P4U577_9PEZI|nr:carbonic anhydrase [Tothia fuscella]